MLTYLMFCFRSLSRQRSWMLSVIWILPLEDLPCWSSRWGDTRGQAWSGPRMVSPFWPETATSSFTPTPSRLLSSSARWILSGRSRCFADWNGFIKMYCPYLLNMRLSVTIWLHYLLPIWLFTTMKNYLIAKITQGVENLAKYEISHEILLMT